VHQLLLIGLVVGRVVGGWGSGIRLMLTRAHVARFTPVDKRPEQQSRFLFTITLGVGLGPLLAAAVKTLDSCRAQRDLFLPVGIAGLTLSCCQLAAALRFPSLAQTPDLLEREESSVCVLDEEEVVQRRRLIISGLAFSVLRGLCLSGVEAATALLLEVRFGWRSFVIGLTIGLAFLSCIPLRILHLRYRPLLSPINWILTMLFISVVGSLLLFRGPHWAFLRLAEEEREIAQAAILLLGDGLLFPSFFLSDGMVQGLILQHPLPPEASVLSLNGLNLFNTLSLDGFARLMGPSISRFYVSEHGQNAYATQQLLLTLAASALAAFCFLPLLHSLSGRKAASGRGSAPVPGG